MRSISSSMAVAVAVRIIGAATDRPSTLPADWRVPVRDADEPRTPRPHSSAVRPVLRADPTDSYGARRIAPR